MLGDQLWSGLLADETAPSRLTDPEAPTLLLSATPETLGLGDPLLVHAEATDNTTLIDLNVSLDGQPLTLDANGNLSLSLDEAGLHRLTASATDGAGNRTDRTLTLTVTDPSDQDAPQIGFEGLAYGDEVTAPTPIVIDVADANLAHWALTYRPLDGSAKAPIASGNAVVSAQTVYRLDPTQLINGLYELELTAQDLNGYVSVDTLVVRVTSEMKVGHFALWPRPIPWGVLPAIPTTAKATSSAAPTRSDTPPAGPTTPRATGSARPMPSEIPPPGPTTPTGMC